MLITCALHVVTRSLEQQQCGFLDVIIGVRGWVRSQRRVYPDLRARQCLCARQWIGGGHNQAFGADWQHSGWLGA